MSRYAQIIEYISPERNLLFVISWIYYILAHYVQLLMYLHTISVADFQVEVFIDNGSYAVFG